MRAALTSHDANPTGPHRGMLRGNARDLRSAPMAPPMKLTDQLVDELCSSVRQGNPLEDAVAAKGIGESTFRRWKQRARERPGSIYGTMRARLQQAEAEASTIDVAILTRAATQPSVTRTTVTKREMVEVSGERQLAVTEETVRTVEKPADPKWAAWKLERRNQRWRQTQQIDAQVQHVPADMLDRSMGELLRLAKGDDGPSLLNDDDDEARALMPAE